MALGLPCTAQSRELKGATGIQTVEPYLTSNVYQQSTNPDPGLLPVRTLPGPPPVPAEISEGSAILT